MEVTVDAAILAPAIQRAKGIARPKPPMPCLGAVLLTASGDKLTITAFDLEVAVVSEVPARVKKPGSVLLNLLAFDFTTSLKGDVTFTRGGSTLHGRCTVEAKGTSARFHEPGDPADFPKLPEANCPTSPLDVPAMRAMLRRVPHAVCRDGARPELCGMYLHTTGDGSHRAVATDGNRIAVLTRKLGDFTFAKHGPLQNVPVEKQGIVLPISAVVKLKEILDGTGPEGWTFGCTSNIAVLRREGFLFLAKLVDAVYPDYTCVVNQERSTIAVQRAGLLEGLERVSLVSKNVGMVLEESGTLRFEAKSDKVGEGRDAMTVKKQRIIPRRAWFPYKHITEALSGAEGEEVLISVPPKDNALGVPAFIQTPGEDGYIACIMPLTGMD